MKSLNTEIYDIPGSIDHPCVIQLLDVIDTENNLYIILELADGGELFDKILEKVKFSEKEAKLYFFHQKGIYLLQVLPAKSIC